MRVPEAVKARYMATFPFIGHDEAMRALKTALEQLREELLAGDVIAGVQRQLSSEGWMMEGHPAYDAAESKKAQDILSDALLAALNSVLGDKEEGS